MNVDSGSIETTLAYPDHDFQYTIKAEEHGEGMLLSVNLSIGLVGLSYANDYLDHKFLLQKGTLVTRHKP